MLKWATTHERPEDQLPISPTDFIGAIPRYYDQHFGPLIFEPYCPELARRVSAPSGGVVLETAAGTGIAARHLHRALGDDVRLIVTDLNPPMLEYARRKLPSASNIEFRAADATRLDFPDASFDVVASQFSLMFFPDKIAAVREAARVLRTSGTFVFCLWDSYEQNHFSRTVNATLTRLFPEHRPDFFDTPYGYYQVDVVRQQLAENGFGPIDIAILPKVSRCDTALDVALGHILGTPVCLQIAERNGPSVDEVVKSVERAVGETFGFADVRAPMQALFFTARLSNAH